jgi:hypothetical protein
MAEAAVLQSSSVFDDVPVANLGTISIRVFVLPPKPKKGSEKEAAVLLDAEEGEAFAFESLGSTPISSYLESTKGKRCVVFLVNGQRQEFLDNSFIVQELGFKYLRARMMIAVDVDGLAPEAIGKMMQGSRQGFYKGHIFEAISKRIVATLKNDPDLIRLEEEAEEAVSELSAGDEKVKQTLDQLIDSHHDHGHDFAEGQGSAGDTKDSDELGFKTVVKDGVVTLLPPDTGMAADYPVLSSGSANVRLRPNQPRDISVKSIPSGHWPAVAQFNVENDASVLELNIKHQKLDTHGKLTLLFNEPEGFDTDQYPVRAKVKVAARFNGIKETRLLELNVLVKPDRDPPEAKLLDDPTYLKVTSREPIRIRVGAGDTHVRLRWDGKDRLLTANVPQWTLKAKVAGDGRPQPEMNFSEPLTGRFSLLISPRQDWKAGDKIKFEIVAAGPRGRELYAAFEAHVVEPPPPPEPDPRKPQLVDGEFKTGQIRRPPYQLKVIKRDDYGQPCWNVDEWTDDDPGSYLAPTDRAPLTLIINEDMAALRDFRRALTKRNTEQDVERKVNKYTSHIAFHLYQMYQATQGRKEEDVDAADALRREEIRRVAMTMIRLMDVAAK